jgi:hypothetical protein
MLSHRQNSHASRSSSTPVAAKRGAVNSPTRLKFFLYRKLNDDFSERVRYQQWESVFGKGQNYNAD